MKKLFKKLFKKSNERGNVLGISAMIMFVLAGSLATITTIAVQQNTTISIKADNTSDENVGMRLIQQSIYEFETYVGSGTFVSLEDYEDNYITDVETNYNVRVSQVSEEIGTTEDGVEYKAYEYRFEYTLNNGKILQMSSFLSSVGSSVMHNGKPITPFNFSIGTNGDLVLSGGYYNNPTPELDNPSFFAKSIYFNAQSPYIEDGAWKITPSSSGTYPDFPDALEGEDTVDMDVYYYDDYEYCGSNCWIVNGVDDPAVLVKDDFVTVVGSGIETGNYEQDDVVPNFFGDFNFEDTVFDFIKNVGPTEPILGHDANDYIFQGNLTSDNYLATIMANTKDPVEYCQEVWVEGYWKWKNNKWKRTWIEGYYYTDYNNCYDVAADAPYTNLTEYKNTFKNEDVSVPVSAVFEGDLTIKRGLHVEDRDNETMIITGDLIIDNNNWITMDGKFVVLGDLIFKGGIVDIDGAFYVFGETLFDFDDYAGINENGDTDEYGLTIISQDNILFESMWKYSSNRWGEFDAFLYTEESIYIEAVSSRIQMRGVFFANAKGVSGNHIPVVDEYGAYINGIVINSYRGYYSRWWNELYPSTDIDYNRFFYMGVLDEDYRAAFVEIPEFESVVFKEDGNYSTERSEFSYLEVIEEE